KSCCIDHSSKVIYLVPFIYGSPRALGASALPIKPASASIVSTYGAIKRNTCGTPAKNGTLEIMTLKLWAKPKNNAAPIAPKGCHFPKITAARDIKPCPTIVEEEKSKAIVKAKTEPPSPPKKPEMITAIYRIRNTFIPFVSAAIGCSPTARSRSPNDVLNKIYQATTARII